ncbi:MAG: 3-dehydroquinate synthase [Gemmatimonadota bacterium]|nr:MAG: 3-dehydroquinate synthase [Gemmatimonadota bacterium]
MGQKVGTTVQVSTGLGPGYGVVVEPGALGRLPALLSELAPAHRYALISDDTVFNLHGHRVMNLLLARGLSVEPFTFPAGEASKTRDTWAALTDRMLDARFGRDSVVLALGGGVTGDLAGFVAASYMRGVPVVQIPTSLVGMIDASVGGKTGVDTPAGKNLVGAFHPPRLVLADPELIATLPIPERAQGLVEAVKHGAIMDLAYLDDLERSMAVLLEAESVQLTWAVARSVELKAGVVAEDEREAGLRQVLNFGHTLAHAIEAAVSYAVPHGSAVGLGMILEARLGEALGITAPGTSERLLRVVRLLGISEHLPSGAAPGEIMSYLGADKKARGGEARFVLLSELGVISRADDWSRPVPTAAIDEILTAAATT